MPMPTLHTWTTLCSDLGTLIRCSLWALTSDYPSSFSLQLVIQRAAWKLGYSYQAGTSSRRPQCADLRATAQHKHTAEHLHTMPSQPVFPENLLEQLGQAELVDRQGTHSTAAQLWRDKPAVVLVLRRPGCVLCRAEAQRLWRLHSQFEALGVNLVTVVHEWREREVEAYAPEFWGGPVYHDVSKAFYKAVNGGHEVLRGSALGLLNPFSAVWKRINEARKEVAKHNVVGEGMIMGGLMVVGKGGTGPYFVHLETDLGVHAQHDEVLAAAKRAAADAVAEPAPAVAGNNGVAQMVAAQ